MELNSKNLLFLGFLAAAGLMAAGCDREGEGSEPDVIEGANTFLSLDIKMSDVATKALDRGYEDYGSEAEHKVKTVCALFYNSDGTYLTAGTKWTGGENENTGDTKPNVESYVKPVITLGPTTIDKDVKMLLFVNDQCHSSWADADGNAVGYFSSLINKPLDEVLELTTSTVPSDEGTFEMTNSAYISTSNDGTNSTNTLVQAAVVPKEYFMETSTAAEDKPFPVYVERTVAKVAMQETSNPQTLESATISSSAPFLYNSANYYPITVNNAPVGFTLDGKQTAFAVTVLGWCPNGVNTKGYLVKHLLDKENTYYYRDTEGSLTKWETESWNDGETIGSDGKASGNYRSYWAEDWNYAEDGKNNDGSTSGGSTETTLTFKSLYTTTTSGTSSTVTAALDKTSDPFYIYENTVAQKYAQYKGNTKHPNVTTMLVSAQIVPLNGSFTNGLNFTLTSTDSPVGTAVDLFRADGVFYTSSAYKAKALSGGYINTGTADTPVYTAITESMFESGGALENMTWSQALLDAKTDSKHYDGVKYTVSYYDLTDSKCVPIYMLFNGSYSKMENLNDLNSNLTNANFQKGVEYFKDGKCFYQVPIEQPVLKEDTSSETGKIYGVVRNHSYVLTLYTIGSVGAPDTGSDETIELIPGQDQYYYLGCTLNVLAWRNVSQSVNF